MSRGALVASAPLALSVLLAVTGCGQSAERRAAVMPPGVSWASLLAEAGDLRTLALPVAPDAQSQLASSCLDSNKVILTHLAPQPFGDLDHGSFADVAEDATGVHATLAEFSGPGAVTWVWSANPAGTLALFIDDAPQPALTMPFRDFLAGRFLPVKSPFASRTSLGHNLHFPLVHARRCKLVLTAPSRVQLSELFYQIAWQSLPADATIQPFDAAAIARETGLLRELGNRLVDTSRATEPLAIDGARPASLSCRLQPGQAAEVFHAPGPAAITSIRFSGKSKADLAGLWLEGTWDGVTSVRVPLPMLAGVSPNLENTQSLPATVQGRQVALRWFMPFAADGRLVCTNASGTACEVTVEVWTQPIDAARYPLRFHADYRTHTGLRTDAGNVLTLAEADGPGRFVGCVLGVDSRSTQWWGEGDPLIWLDDDSRAAWQGTGTEDYFGFAWCSRGIFNHPFRAQTTVGGDGSRRLAQMHRYHLLDRLPFHHRGRFQFEAWGLGPGTMDWTTALLWYKEPL